MLLRLNAMGALSGRLTAKGTDDESCGGGTGGRKGLGRHQIAVVIRVGGVVMGEGVPPGLLVRWPMNSTRMEPREYPT